MPSASNSAPAVAWLAFALLVIVAARIRAIRDQPRGASITILLATLAVSVWTAVLLRGPGVPGGSTGAVCLVYLGVCAAVVAVVNECIHFGRRATGDAVRLNDDGHPVGDKVHRLRSLTSRMLHASRMMALLAGVTFALTLCRLTNIETPLAFASMALLSLVVAGCMQLLSWRRLDGSM